LQPNEYRLNIIGKKIEGGWNKKIIFKNISNKTNNNQNNDDQT
jgi:hypothetical protein